MNDSSTRGYTLTFSLLWAVILTPDLASAGSISWNKVFYRLPDALPIYNRILGSDGVLAEVDITWAWVRSGSHTVWLPNWALETEWPWMVTKIRLGQFAGRLGEVGLNVQYDAPGKQRYFWRKNSPKGLVLGVIPPEVLPKVISAGRISGILTTGRLRTEFMRRMRIPRSTVYRMLERGVTFRHARALKILEEIEANKAQISEVPSRLISSEELQAAAQVYGFMAEFERRLEVGPGLGHVWLKTGVPPGYPDARSIFKVMTQIPRMTGHDLEAIRIENEWTREQFRQKADVSARNYYQITSQAECALTFLMAEQFFGIPEVRDYFGG